MDDPRHSGSEPPGSGPGFETAVEGVFRPELQRRFLYFISITACISLCAGYLYSALHTDLDATRNITVGLGLAGFSSALLTVRLKTSITWSAGILILTGLGLTLVPAYYDGGVRSPYAVWFVVIPLVVGLTLGPRIAYLSGVAGAVAMIGLGTFAASLPQPPSELHSTPMLTMNLVLAITFCAFMGGLVSTTIRRSSRELHASRNAAISKNIELAETNQRFKGSVNVAADAIIMTNSSNIIEVFNPAAEAMYELPAGDAIGKEMPTLLIPERLRESHWRAFERYLKSGHPNIIGTPIETHSIRFDGSEFPIELTVQEVSGTKEKQFIAYIRDLTERNRLQQEVEQQGKQLDLKRRLEAIGTLSGGVAHDFNNLLMAINGHTELLLLRNDLSDEARENIHEIEHAGERASKITKQLLAFSRSDRMEPEHVNIERMISGLVVLLERILPDSIRFEISLESSTWPVRSEGARLEQAILNMILNATDAMPEGGTISLHSRNIVIDVAQAARVGQLQAGEYGLIEVSDEGIGMDEETLQRIFDPFFTTKAAGEGTGLGLSTAYGIVEQCEGAIDVESTIGVGSKFSIYLPRAGEVEEHFTEPEPPFETLKGNQETILVVEDEASVRRLVVRTLAGEGYRIIEAVDGQQGYELALQHAKEIDLIVTDLVMPNLSGVKMVRRLRLGDLDFKVIYVSGHSEDEFASGNKEDPGTTFLYKPFNLGLLKATVREMLHGETRPIG